ncbi:MAG: HlyD family type I secretion periplasmic adaptor subunit [Devosiaceae bacterium]|nr:HlyD family type I secretion periplasmic adaptor subunit [Devosiaceae bacterium]
MGFTTIFLIFGGVGAWAALTKISGAVIASGSISVESNIKTIQHLEGGIVAEIFVVDGDRVEAGAPLLQLDAAALRANLTIAVNNLVELLSRQAMLEGELEGRATIIFPDEITEKAEAGLARRIIAGKTALFDARRETRLGQQRMMEQRIVQFKEQILGMDAQMQSQIGQAQILQGSIERKQEATDSGVVSQDAMDQLRRAHLQLVGGVGELRSSIAGIASTIAQAELQILQIDVDLRESAQSELREVLARIAELREQENAMRETLKRTLVTAPVSGRIHNLTIFTIGGIVPPGSPILQIIPENDRLIIESKVLVTDIDQISIGQEAKVVLSAFDSRTTPDLNAHVTNISAAPLLDKLTNIPYFSVRLEISENELSRLDEGQQLLPGMPADSYIRTDERTPLDYIIKPLADQIQRAFKEQ